jgi:hypothetical protein
MGTSQRVNLPMEEEDFEEIYVVCGMKNLITLINRFYGSSDR